MEPTYSNLRRVTMDYFKSNPRGQINFVDRQHGIIAWLLNAGVPLTDETRDTVQVVVHDLYRERILITGAGGTSMGDALLNWPHYRVTQHGREVLAATDYQPYDPGGYLERFRADVPNADGEIIRYLAEALDCSKQGLTLACAVMIGCAAEKTMTELASALRAYLPESKRKKFDNETGSRSITRAAKAVTDRLREIQKTLTENIRDDWEITVSSVFNLIRITRNEAGHPTGARIDQATVEGHLIIFPAYCGKAYQLISFLSASTPSK